MQPTQTQQTCYTERRSSTTAKRTHSTHALALAADEAVQHDDKGAKGQFSAAKRCPKAWAERRKRRVRAVISLSGTLARG